MDTIGVVMNVLVKQTCTGTNLQNADGVFLPQLRISRYLGHNRPKEFFLSTS